jgi:ribonucleoside-diphosphate reductase alpha chain
MNKDIEKLLKERYFHNGEKTWDDLTNRVSKVYVPIKEYLINKDFIFSSPTLMNFKVDNENGRQMGTLSSCFPMEIKDSLDDIGESVKEAMLVTKASGGVGYDFSFLRGSNEVISSFDRNSSGPISFIRMVNSVLEEIRQGGRRKGAGAAQMNIYHPNILDFIECKKDYNDPRYKRFNNTVRIPDSFMEVLKNNPNEIMKVQNVIDKQWHELKDSKGNLVTYKTLWDKITTPFYSMKRFAEDLCYNLKPRKLKQLFQLNRQFSI